MFTESQDVSLTILNGGFINVTIVKHYFKDGVEIGQEDWGCCLEPHPAYLEHAETFLDNYYINIIKSVWTEEVINAYMTSLIK